MKIIHLNDIAGTEREVNCPKDGFTSYRFLLERDGLGFSMTKTIIPPNDWQYWHYKNHQEACFCIKGRGVIRNIESGETSAIFPGIMYAPEHDRHEFMAYEEVELICVFNPPLKGSEVHQEDGSYGI